LKSYKKEGASPDKVLVHFPSSGFCVPVFDVAEKFSVSTVHAIGLQYLVVTVQVRVAPEAKFPAQHHDAIQAISYLASDAAVDWLGMKPLEFLFVGHGSGATILLSALVNERKLDHIKMRGAVVMTPTINHLCNTASYERVGDRFSFLNSALTKVQFCWKQLLDCNSNYDGIDFEKNKCTAFPPTLVMTCNQDPCEDDGYAIIDSLKKIGTKVTHVAQAGCAPECFGGQSNEVVKKTVTQLETWLNTL